MTENYLEAYEKRLNEYKHASWKEPPSNKHAALYTACANGEIHLEHFDNKIEAISGREGDSDFCMLPLIRVLYQDVSKWAKKEQEKMKDLQERTKLALEGFPFLPKEGQQIMDEIVFWSENHLFMTLTSAYLFYQQTEMTNGVPDWESKHPECRLLRKYLEIHLHESFNGVYEVNSHVYLPFTLNALLNLYDFAVDSGIKNQANRLIDRIVELLALATDPSSGIINLSASARAFKRTRVRNHGHSINQFIYFLCGKCPNPYEWTAIVSPLLLTGWKPKNEVFTTFLPFKGFFSQQVSHRLKDIYIIYGCDDFESPEDGHYIPLLWSAGLITHPDFAHLTRHYQKKFCLERNKHLWPLAYFFWTESSLVWSLEAYRHFSKGQAYTDICFNLYKQPSAGLMLSSFERFSPHLAAFQQLSWMANVAGIPVWSQSGLGSESIANFSINNTHNPCCQQRDNVLLVSYVAPAMLTSTTIVGNLFSTIVRFFWPAPFFDEDILVASGRTLHGSETLLKQFWTKHRAEQKKLSAAPRRLLNIFAHSLFDSKKESKASAAMPSYQEGTEEQEDVAVTEDHKSLSHRAMAEVLSKNRNLCYWRVGRRGSAYIAVLCTKNCSVDTANCKDATIQPMMDMPEVSIPRMVCHSNRQSWVIAVGTQEQYGSLRGFVDEHLQYLVVEQSGGSSNYMGLMKEPYRVSVLHKNDLGFRIQYRQDKLEDDAFSSSSTATAAAHGSSEARDMEMTTKTVATPTVRKKSDSQLAALDSDEDPAQYDVV